jgi:hypothetical protein
MLDIKIAIIINLKTNYYKFKNKYDKKGKFSNGCKVAVTLFKSTVTSCPVRTRGFLNLSLQKTIDS